MLSANVSRAVRLRGFSKSALNFPRKFCMFRSFDFVSILSVFALTRFKFSIPIIGFRARTSVFQFSCSVTVQFGVDRENARSRQVNFNIKRGRHLSPSRALHDWVVLSRSSTNKPLHYASASKRSIHSLLLIAIYWRNFFLRLRLFFEFTNRV